VRPPDQEVEEKSGPGRIRPNTYRWDRRQPRVSRIIPPVHTMPSQMAVVSKASINYLQDEMKKKGGV